METGGVHGTRSFVVVTELPYQIPKSTVIEEIAALVEKGTLTGISDVQDESDRTGMRIVIELKRGVESNVVVNNLFKHSRLQTRFSANMVALVDNIPEQLTLRRILETFFQFRYQVCHSFGFLDLLPLLTHRCTLLNTDISLARSDSAYKVLVCSMHTSVQTPAMCCANTLASSSSQYAFRSNSSHSGDRKESGATAANSQSTQTHSGGLFARC